MRIEPSNVKKKKVRKPPNVRKKLSHVILELHNVRREPSSMKKKIRKPPNVTKELLYVMLESHNVRMKPSNVRKKKKLRESPNVRKNCHM